MISDFHQKRDRLDFFFGGGGSKIPGGGKKVDKTSKNKKKNYQGSKWNQKFEGRSCFITIGAFGHGLL